MERKATSPLIARVDPSITTRALHPLSPEAKRFIKDHTYPVNLNARTLLLAAGQVTDQIYILRWGVLRCVYTTGNQAQTVGFITESQIVPFVVDFYFRAPMQYTIISVGPCMLEMMLHRRFVELYQNFPEIQESMPTLIGQSRQSPHERTLLVGRKYDQRLKHFLTVFPGLIDQVPHIHIASFLGMTPETLSRLYTRYKALQPK